MAVDEGSYRLSGQFGEGFYTDPNGVNPARKIFEASSIKWNFEIASEDVPLGGNETGSKDGGVTKTATMVLQQVDTFWQRLVLARDPSNVTARRAARNAGRRADYSFTLLAWLDDPDALGVVAHELGVCTVNTTSGGYDWSETVTGLEVPLKYRKIREVHGFEINGNQIDPRTGLPQIHRQT